MFIVILDGMNHLEESFRSNQVEDVVIINNKGGLPETILMENCY